MRCIKLVRNTKKFRQTMQKGKKIIPNFNTTTQHLLRYWNWVLVFAQGRKSIPNFNTTQPGYKREISWNQRIITEYSSLRWFDVSYWSNFSVKSTHFDENCFCVNLTKVLLFRIKNMYHFYKIMEITEIYPHFKNFSWNQFVA